MLDLKQNTESWLEFRKKGLGASDSPIIMGFSKYAKPYELFLEKTNQAEPKKVNEFITGLGHKFEPIALAHYNLMEDAEFEPRLVQMEEYDWLRASLDGFYEGRPMEIKYVGREKLMRARAKDIAIDHWIQMQHQLMVTGANECVYLCYTLNSGRTEIDETYYQLVSYDKDYVTNKLWPELYKFWSKVQAGVW